MSAPSVGCPRSTVMQPTGAIIRRWTARPAATHPAMDPVKGYEKIVAPDWDFNRRNFAFVEIIAEFRESNFGPSKPPKTLKGVESTPLLSLIHI